MEFRIAERKDCALILSFIKELAKYEHLENEVVATEKLLEEWIFDKNKAEVLFVLEEGKEVGFALYFHNFSTFLGRAGIHLEDLFVLPEYRGKGYGKEAMKALLKEAFENMNINRFWLDVYPDNVIGIKLYESLGMHRDGILRQNYKAERGYLDQIIYSMLKSEYFSER